ncbi:MAG: hypothetical protein HZB91_07715 [Elusimicrobia bacterium]|nr:hypothetical protein [Elusimicrobiota bacterium]
MTDSHSFPDAGPETTLPDWAFAAIRKAAARSCLEWALPMAAAVILLTGIGALIYLGGAEKPWIPFFWLTVFGAALAVFCWEFFVSLRVLLSPGSSKELAYLGRFGPLNQILSEVQGELANPANARFGQEATVTSRWLVVSGGSRFAVRKLDDLVWAFPKDEIFKVFWTIPLRRFPYAEFRSAVGEGFKARCSDEEVAALLDHVSRRCPWVVIGWSAETERLWDADPGAFSAAVQGKRKAG